MVNPIYALSWPHYGLKKLAIPWDLQEKLLISDDFADPEDRLNDLVSCVRTGAGVYGGLEMVDEEIVINIGMETYHIYQRPKEIDAVSWQEFCRIVCEAGFVMETLEENIAARKQLVALDMILTEAIGRFGGDMYVDYNNEAYTDNTQQVLENVLGEYILIGGYYTGQITYDYIDYVHEINKKIFEEDDEYSEKEYRNDLNILVMKILDLFSDLALDNVVMIRNIIRDVDNLTQEKMYEALKLAFKTDRNYRLLTRRSTIVRANNLYIDYA